MKLISRMIVAAVVLMVFAASARAQGVGVRAGASADPDLFCAGDISRAANWPSTCDLGRLSRLSLVQPFRWLP